MSRPSGNFREQTNDGGNANLYLVGKLIAISSVYPTSAEAHYDLSAHGRWLRKSKVVWQALTEFTLLSELCAEGSPSEATADLEDLWEDVESYLPSNLSYLSDFRKRLIIAKLLISL